MPADAPCRFTSDKAIKYDAAVKVRIGDVCRVTFPRGAPTQLLSYRELTAGRHAVPADILKGIFFYREVAEPDGSGVRLPAFIFHSNPLKTDTSINPWSDVIDADAGYALFHGDNKEPAAPASAARGNARLISIYHQYMDASLRPNAPPILVFKQRAVNGHRKGFREFSGYGVPTAMRLLTQRDAKLGVYFSNLAIELALFDLNEEHNEFDWRWIDDRRDGALLGRDTLRSAPNAWRRWVSGGASVIESCRRNVYQQRVVDPKEQLALSSDQREVIDILRHRYSGGRHYLFEALASFVSKEILGDRYRRGWVTKRSADGGYDFVSYMILGDHARGISRSTAIVLGQAKCIATRTCVSGGDIARLVARLQRGWIGVFVTTGWFSIAVQREVFVDRYPVVLVNGKRLTAALLSVMTRENVALADILDQEEEWYHTNCRSLPADRIADTM